MKDLAGKLCNVDYKQSILSKFLVDLIATFSMLVLWMKWVGLKAIGLTGEQLVLFGSPLKKFHLFCNQRFFVFSDFLKMVEKKERLKTRKIRKPIEFFVSLP